MANIEELKKLADEKGVELSEEDIETIVGGLYSKEEWRAMTPDERDAAVKQSMMIRLAGTGEYCKYFDRDPE